MKRLWKRVLDFFNIKVIILRMDKKPDKNFTAHKILEMSVDVENERVILVTAGEGKKALHSMTLNTAYAKGLLDYRVMNKIIF